MTPTNIILHDTDSPYGNPWVVDTWHKKRGFHYDHSATGTEMSIGYHYLILNGFQWGMELYDETWDGVVCPCRPEWAQGAHCLNQGMNTKSLGISLVGPVDGHFSQKQKDSLRSLVWHLMEKYMIPKENVLGHAEVDDKKSDPRFDLGAFRKQL